MRRLLTAFLLFSTILSASGQWRWENPFVKGTNVVLTGVISAGIISGYASAYRAMPAFTPAAAEATAMETSAGVVAAEEGVTEFVAAKSNSIFSQITPKIVKQMGRRGWTKELIHETVNNPFSTRVASNRATGNAATAYFQKNGSYIVKDNITNEVIQINNRLDTKWVPDATIIDPYIPK